MKEPPFGLDQFGLDPYVNPSHLNLYRLDAKASLDTPSGYPNNEDRRSRDVSLPTEAAIVKSLNEKVVMEAVSANRCRVLARLPVREVRGDFGNRTIRP